LRPLLGIFLVKETGILDENLPQCRIFHLDSNIIDADSNLDRRCEKLESHRLGYSTASLMKMLG
jgi:hypothetical protein